MGRCVCDQMCLPSPSPALLLPHLCYRSDLFPAEGGHLRPAVGSQSRLSVTLDAPHPLLSCQLAWACSDSPVRPLWVSASPPRLSPCLSAVPLCLAERFLLGWACLAAERRSVSTTYVLGMVRVWGHLVLTATL